MPILVSLVPFHASPTGIQIPAQTDGACDETIRSMDLCEKAANQLQDHGVSWLNQRKVSLGRQRIVIAWGMSTGISKVAANRVAAW